MLQRAPPRSAFASRREQPDHTFSVAIERQATMLFRRTNGKPPAYRSYWFSLTGRIFAAHSLPPTPSFTARRRLPSRAQPSNNVTYAAQPVAPPDHYKRLKGGLSAAAVAVRSSDAFHSAFTPPHHSPSSISAMTPGVHQHRHHDTPVSPVHDEPPQRVFIPRYATLPLILPERAHDCRTLLLMYFIIIIAILRLAFADAVFAAGCHFAPTPSPAPPATIADATCPMLPLFAAACAMLMPA